MAGSFFGADKVRVDVGAPIRLAGRVKGTVRLGDEVGPAAFDAGAPIRISDREPHTDSARGEAELGAIGTDSGASLRPAGRWEHPEGSRSEAELGPDGRETGPRPSVALRDAVVVLGSFPALSGCSFTVRPGEVALLRGPNGSGKTTVLKVCAGLVPLTAGRVVILGRDLDKHLGRNRRAIRADVGFLSHAGFLYDDLTVADNVRFAIRASGGNPSAATAAMERVGIDSRVAALAVHACSAGQRRRASLAAVVARSPKLWLLDEPHTGLDADSRDLLDALVREAASAGSTVILASHDDDRAAALATRTLHLSGGHVVHETIGSVVYGSAVYGPASAEQDQQNQATRASTPNNALSPLLNSNSAPTSERLTDRSTNPAADSVLPSAAGPDSVVRS